MAAESYEHTFPPGGQYSIHLLINEWVTCVLQLSGVNYSQTHHILLLHRLYSRIRTPLVLGFQCQNNVTMVHWGDLVVSTAGTSILAIYLSHTEKNMPDVLTAAPVLNLSSCRMHFLATHFFDCTWFCAVNTSNYDEIMFRTLTKFLCKFAFCNNKIIDIRERGLGIWQHHSPVFFCVLLKPTGSYMVLLSTTHWDRIQFCKNDRIAYSTLDNWSQELEYAPCRIYTHAPQIMCYRLQPCRPSFFFLLHVAAAANPAVVLCCVVVVFAKRGEQGVVQ